MEALLLLQRLYTPVERIAVVTEAIYLIANRSRPGLGAVRATSHNIRTLYVTINSSLRERGDDGSVQSLTAQTRKARRGLSQSQERNERSQAQAPPPSRGDQVRRQLTQQS